MDVDCATTMLSSHHYSIRDWHQQRSAGFPSKTRLKPSQMGAHLYKNMKTVNVWNPRDTVDHSDHGGVFNFDFSPDGCLLVAACERRSILMFDPLRASLVSHKLDAHSNCVNCVRFLDSRLFATCSDDTNIALWDARYLKRQICLLQGHSNWVKNIEYSRDTGQLVTSGFDGSIYSWDINRYSDCEATHKLLFRSSGLIRTKLTGDGAKMIISTSAGYLIIIHDLDLSTLAHDLTGFKPDIFRLMQLTKSSQRLGVNYRHLFTRARNRVEFVSDFPPENDAEVVSSLQVHPHGWCVLSRNTSSDDLTEWSCVHDIQGRAPLSDDDAGDSNSEEAQDEGASDVKTYTHDINSLGAALMFSIMASPSSPGGESSMVDSQFDNDLTNALRGIRPRDENPAPRPSTSVFDDERSNETSRDVVDESSNSSSALITHESALDEVNTLSTRRSVYIRNTAARPRNSTPARNFASVSNNTPPSNDASPSNAASPSNSESRGTSTSAARTRQHAPHRIVTFRLQLDGHNAAPDRPLVSRTLSRTVYLSGFSYGSPPHKDKVVRIHDNVARLLAYTQEPNTGRGFIKEPCFTLDGRVICSPFGFGVRLLAFDPTCRELCDCVPGKPTQLYEIASNMAHSNAVVTTKFSPVHNLLVTGGLDGKIGFHQPLFQS